jgi:hypothetical protein
MDCEGGCTKYADLMTTETAVKNYVNFVKTYAQSQLDLASSTSFPNNGYEMVQYPQLATNVGSYIKSHGYGLVQDFLNFLSAVNPISGFNPPSMTLRVHLADGSTALFVYDHVTQTWVRVKGQTKDANGNTIPETAADASGGAGSTIVYTFYTNPNNLYDFLNRLGQLGVPISNPNNITGGGITCAGGPANCVQWK